MGLVRLLIIVDSQVFHFPSLMLCREEVILCWRTNFKGVWRVETIGSDPTSSYWGWYVVLHARSWLNEHIVIFPANLCLIPLLKLNIQKQHHLYWLIMMPLKQLLLTSKRSYANPRLETAMSDFISRCKNHSSSTEGGWFTSWGYLQGKPVADQPQKKIVQFFISGNCCSSTSWWW